MGEFPFSYEVAHTSVSKVSPIKLMARWLIRDVCSKCEVLSTPTYNWLSRISCAKLMLIVQAHVVERGQIPLVHRIAASAASGDESAFPLDLVNELSSGVVDSSFKWTGGRAGESLEGAQAANVRTSAVRLAAASCLARCVVLPFSTLLLRLPSPPSHLSLERSLWAWDKQALFTEMERKPTTFPGQ